MHADFGGYERAFTMQSIPREPALDVSTGTDDLTSHFARVHLLREQLELKVRRLLYACRGAVYVDGDLLVYLRPRSHPLEERCIRHDAEVFHVLVSHVLCLQ